MNSTAPHSHLQALAVPAGPRFSRTERLVTGWAAVLGAAFSLVMVALYFVYSGPPPQANVLSRNLLTLATFTVFLVFAVGLGRMLRSDGGGDAGLAGELATTVLRTYVTVTLVATSLEVGTSLQYPDGSLDPTVDGPLAAGMVLLHGPIARVLVAVFLVALALAPAARQRFSRRVLTGSIVLAAINLALVPSLFFGMDAAQFYAANGWGATASIGAVNVIWFAVLGRSVLRSADRTHARGQHRVAGLAARLTEVASGPLGSERAGGAVTCGGPGPFHPSAASRRRPGRSRARRLGASRRSRSARTAPGSRPSPRSCRG